VPPTTKPILFTLRVDPLWIDRRPFLKYSKCPFGPHTSMVSPTLSRSRCEVMQPLGYTLISNSMNPLRSSPWMGV